MQFLLDTNVISEGLKPRVDPGVAAWMGAQSSRELALSALSLGEIRKGAVLLGAGRRKEELEQWLEFVLPRQFAGRILPIDEQIALVWGSLSAEAKQKGRHLPVVDGLLVSTAIVHGLALVTRNERDCTGWGASILNPWSN